MIKPAVAARLLGCKLSEIDRVDSSPAGDVIVTRDGASYVNVPENNPDSEGKTGLMLLAAPSDHPVAVVDGHSFWNSFPLYRMPDEDTDDGTDDDGVAGDTFDTDTSTPVSTDQVTNPSDTVTSDGPDLAEIRQDLEARGMDELRDMARARELDVPLNKKDPIIDALIPVLAAEETT